MKFRVAIHTRLDGHRISFEATEEPLGSVLKRLLPGIAYSLNYEGDSLALLEVGAPETLAEADRESREPDERRALRKGELARRLAERKAERAARPPKPPQSEEERRRIAAGRAARQEVRRLENLAMLQDPDPEERGHAVFVLDARNPEERVYLAAALEKDSDPSVRVEAARQLGFGEARDVTPVLYEALRDSSSEVVLAALDSISFVADQSAVRELEPLLEHSDPAVRNEANKTIEFLMMVQR